VGAASLRQVLALTQKVDQKNVGGVDCGTRAAAPTGTPRLVTDPKKNDGVALGRAWRGFPLARRPEANQGSRLERMAKPV